MERKAVRSTNVASVGYAADFGFRISDCGLKTRRANDGLTSFHSPLPFVYPVNPVHPCSPWRSLRLGGEKSPSAFIGANRRLVL